MFSIVLMFLCFNVFMILNSAPSISIFNKPIFLILFSSINFLRLVAGKKLNTKLYLSKNTHNHSTMPLSKNCIQVPATNLKKLMEENKIKKIGLLKMDIEGAEFNIIKTLKHKNIKTIENMVIEYHESGNNKREDLENITRQHGFSVEHFPNKFDKRFGLLVCRNKKTG